jgi:hypothetical protein
VRLQITQHIILVASTAEQRYRHGLSGELVQIAGSLAPFDIMLLNRVESKKNYDLQTILRFVCAFIGAWRLAPLVALDLQDIG